MVGVLGHGYLGVGGRVKDTCLAVCVICYRPVAAMCTELGLEGALGVLTGLGADVSQL
jgi:hypothetical protein